MTFDDTPHLVYAANLSGSWMAGFQGYESQEGLKVVSVAIEPN